MSLEMQLIQINSEINNLRALDYILRSPEFHSVYKNQPEADYYIQVRDVEALKVWIKGQQTGNLEAYNVKQLREIARHLRIKDWNILNKENLIKEITWSRKSSTYTNSLPIS